MYIYQLKYYFIILFIFIIDSFQLVDLIINDNPEDIKFNNIANLIPGT